MSRPTPWCCASFLLLLTGWSLTTLADAVVRSQAMLAPTVCEVFVESNQIQVELEIGFKDLRAFRNLLPDGLYQRLGYEARPTQERLQEFLDQDWLLTADGLPLAGQLTQIEPRSRVRRDVVTGEPVGTAGKEETVVFTRIAYPLESTPSVLALAPPGRGRRSEEMPAIGFVVYHLGVPVNDFRYLGREEFLDLDWEDPWYSRFRTRALQRAYNSPINAFLYIEPYEVRVEIIARPKDLQQWIDLGLPEREVLPAEIQANVKERAAEFLAEHIMLTIDDEAVVPELDRINFLRRTLRTSSVIDPPADLNLFSATLGAIFVVPTTTLADQATLTWDLFSPKLPEVRAAATDEAGPMPYTLRPDDNVLVWKNFLTSPTIPTLLPVEPPVSGWVQRATAIGWALCGALGIFGVWLGFRLKRSSAAMRFAFAANTVILVSLALGTLAVARSTQFDVERTRTVVGPLLHNVYRAFDFRDEETIYDTLAQSITGDLLTQVYLETRQGLELANQGGARVKVKEVNLLGAEPRPLRGARGFTVRCLWNVRGSVGHWGHLHQRTNQYEAELTIQPREGRWKITALDLLQEQRVN